MVNLWVVEVADGLGRTLNRAVFETKSGAEQYAVQLAAVQFRKVHLWRL